MHWEDQSLVFLRNSPSNENGHRYRALVTMLPQWQKGAIAFWPQIQRYYLGYNSPITSHLEARLNFDDPYMSASLRIIVTASYRNSWPDGLRASYYRSMANKPATLAIKKRGRTNNEESSVNMKNHDLPKLSNSRMRVP